MIDQSVTVVSSKPSTRSMSTVVSAWVVLSTSLAPPVAWVASPWQAAPSTATIASAPLLTMLPLAFIIAAPPLFVEPKTGGPETS